MIRQWSGRIAHFFIVWSILLAVHEGGHAMAARHQGLSVAMVSVGVGPVLWSGEVDDTKLVLRLVPLVGLTRVENQASAPTRWDEWREGARILGGGAAATLTLVLLFAGAVVALEGWRARRCELGRLVIADALVLTVFNLLPVPPLDGGSAALSAVSAWRGEPLSADALFWVRMGGVALAAVPMLLWTRWTRYIDHFVMAYGSRPTRRVAQTSVVRGDSSCCPRSDP